uniref:G_PROTEIN_RECEP_F1_2 domain-containing protein n=1 Tax=Macrostomum lignano TaxID=282301 RepID=A0A1I8HY28_9PLAT
IQFSNSEQQIQLPPEEALTSDPVLEDIVNIPETGQHREVKLSFFQLQGLRKPKRKEEASSAGAARYLRTGGAHAGKSQPEAERANRKNRRKKSLQKMPVTAASLMNGGNSTVDVDSDAAKEAAALELLAAVYKYLFAWLVPLLYVSGCAGTIVCVTVLLRRGSTQKEARPWFIALSLTDLCVLSVGLPIMYLNIVRAIVKAELSPTATVGSYDPRSWNAPACYGLTILQYYGLIASSWVQVGISLTRCLSAVMPLACRRRLNYAASKRALAVTLAVPIVLAVAAVTSSVKYYERSEANNGTGGGGGSGGVCAQKWKSPYYFYSTLVLRVFFPAVCLAVSSAGIMYSLHRFKRTFPTDQARLSQQQRRISIALIGMNSTFLLFALPYELYLIYATERRADLQRGGPAHAAALKIAERVFAVLMYTNNATNWIFYFVLGHRFRQELQRRLFVCCSTPASSGKAVAQYKFRPERAPLPVTPPLTPPPIQHRAPRQPPPPPSLEAIDYDDSDEIVGAASEELRPLRGPRSVGDQRWTTSGCDSGGSGSSASRRRRERKYRDCVGYRLTSKRFASENLIKFFRPIFTIGEQLILTHTPGSFGSLLLCLIRAGKHLHLFIKFLGLAISHLPRCHWFRVFGFFWFLVFVARLPIESGIISIDFFISKSAKTARCAASCHNLLLQLQIVESAVVGAEFPSAAAALSVSVSSNSGQYLSELSNLRLHCNVSEKPDYIFWYYSTVPGGTDRAVLARCHWDSATCAVESGFKAWANLVVMGNGTLSLAGVARSQDGYYECEAFRDRLDAKEGIRVVVVGPDIPVLGPDIPVLDPDIPILGPNIPVLGPDIPILDPEILILGPDIPVLGPDIPVLDPDIPILGPNIPVLGPDIPVPHHQSGEKREKERHRGVRGGLKSRGKSRIEASREAGKLVPAAASRGSRRNRRECEVFNGAFAAKRWPMATEKVKITQSFSIVTGSEPSIVQSPTQLTSGDLATFSCNSGSGWNPPPRLTWLRNSIDKPAGDDLTALALYSPPAAKFGPASSVLRLTVGADDHEAVLICTAAQTELSNASVSAAQLKLLVKHKPSIGSIADLTAVEGSSVPVACSAGGYPAPRLQLIGANGSVMQESASGMFTLYPVDRSQAGALACRAVNPLGTATAAFRLSVLYQPTVRTPASAVVDAGGSVTLPCSVDGNPPPAELVWRHDATGAALPPSSDGALRLDGADPRRHAGVWHCEARSILTASSGPPTEYTASSAVVLTVRYRPGLPQASQPRSPLLAGESVNLTCQPSQVSPGEPAPSLAWVRIQSSPVHLPAGPSVRFSPVGLSDSGSYACRAVNDLGTSESAPVSLLVHQAPSLTVESAPTGANAARVGSTNFRLVCRVRANPAPRLRWLRNGARMPPELFTELAGLGDQSFEYQLTLHFRGFQRSVLRLNDTGVYQCFADNELGNSTAEHRLEVLTQPSIVNAFDKAAFVPGRRPALACQFISHSGFSVTWRTPDGRTLTTGSAQPVEEANGQPWWMTSPAPLADGGSQPAIGNYTCQVNNSLGTVQRRLQLVAASAPDPPERLSAAPLAWDSVRLFWKPGFDGGHPAKLRLRLVGWNASVGARMPTSPPLLVDAEVGEATIGGLYPDTAYDVVCVAENRLGESPAFGAADNNAAVVVTTGHLRLPQVRDASWDPATGRLVFRGQPGYCARVEASSDAGATWRAPPNADAVGCLAFQADGLSVATAPASVPADASPSESASSSTGSLTSTSSEARRTEILYRVSLCLANRT